MIATFNLSPGQKFSRLTFIQELSPKERGSKLRIGLFFCECGRKINLFISNVITGRTKSCGCYNRELTVKRNYRHGLSKTDLYDKWNRIKYRCENKNAKAYSNYGGKGIKLSAEWQIFENFYRDMQDSYEDHLLKFGRKETTIDRIDSNGDYSKENCRWATAQEQGNNTSQNKLYEWHGKIYTRSNLAREVGLTPRQLQKRLALGWDLERALMEPVKAWKHI